MNNAVFRTVILALAVLAPATAARADEIDRRCRSEWGADYDMVLYCVENQRRAKREIGAFSGPIRQRCEREWSDDYEMAMDCIRTQTEARSNLTRKPDDPIARHCRDEWGADFEMVEYCDNNQRSAKRVIERS